MARKGVGANAISSCSPKPILLQGGGGGGGGGGGISSLLCLVGKVGTAFLCVCVCSYSASGDCRLSASCSSFHVSAAGADKALMLACSCLNSISKNNDSGGTLSFNVYFMLHSVGVQGWKLGSARLGSVQRLPRV